MWWVTWYINTNKSLHGDCPDSNLWTRKFESIHFLRFSKPLATRYNSATVTGHVVRDLLLMVGYDITWTLQIEWHQRKLCSSNLHRICKCSTCNNPIISLSLKSVFIRGLYVIKTKSRKVLRGKLDVNWIESLYAFVN